MTKPMNKSTEFETLVRDLLSAQLAVDIPGAKFDVKHDQQLTGKSGHSHQIDVVAELIVADIRILLLVECKRYSRRVGIDDVMEFAGRIDDLAAHKGILVTTVGFERGAIRFAKSRGIALVLAAECGWISKVAYISPEGYKHLAEAYRHRLKDRRQLIPKLLTDYFGITRFPDDLNEAVFTNDFETRERFDGLRPYSVGRSEATSGKPVLVLCTDEPDYEKLLFTNLASDLPDGVFDIRWLFNSTERTDVHRRLQLYKTDGFFPKTHSVILDASTLLSVVALSAYEQLKCHLTNA